MNKEQRQQVDSFMNEVAPSAKAYAVISVSYEGQCRMLIQGQVFELAFMDLSFNDYIRKIMNGTAQSEPVPVPSLEIVPKGPK